MSGTFARHEHTRAIKHDGGNMDPNKALEDARTIAARILSHVDAGEIVSQDDAIALAEHFDNLDTWLKNGGFKPKDWRS